MSLRVTQSGLYATTLASLARQSSSLAKLNTQLSTGKRIISPADDPSGTRNLLLHKSVLGTLDSRVSTIQSVRNWLTHSETQLTDAQDIMVRTREIAMQGRQSTDSTERHTLASELDTMLERLVSIANTKNEGLYLYSGNQSTTAPYTLENGKVTYHGSDVGMSAPTGDGVDFPMLYSGAEIFGYTDRGSTVVLGATGLQAGTGTSNGSGSSTITVRHVATTYAGGSGIQTGTNSVAGDTVVGPSGSNSIVIRAASGTSGTLSLNGGPEIAYTNADQNLKVTGNRGEVVFVNTQNITPGFQGTVNITSTATLSIDDGATEIPLTSGSNVALTDSRTGAVTYVNTSAVRQAGNAHVEYTGTSDAFSVLTELRDALRNDNQLGASDWQATMSRRIADVERLQDHLYDIRGSQAVSQQQLDQLQERTEDLQLATKKDVADIENIDLTEVVIKLQESQNQMQFALAAIARVNDASLLNYLR